MKVEGLFSGSYNPTVQTSRPTRYRSSILMRTLKTSNRPLVFAICAIALFFLCVNEAGAQDLSRWTWKPYAIGTTGLYLDLPRPPSRRGW